ncbi:MAG: hypothetical protein AAFX96_06335 [Pseudomonadota bacterium]
MSTFLYKQRAALLGAVLLLDRRGALKEQPGERVVERLSFPKYKTLLSLPVQA